MTTVTGLTAERMLEIEAASIVDGEVVGNDLILTKHDNSTINAGNVRGAMGPPGANFRGNYDVGITYALGDWVTGSNGLPYCSLQNANIAHNPLTEVAWWQSWLPGSVVEDSSTDADSPIIVSSSPRNRALRDFVSVLDYGTYLSPPSDMTSILISAANDAKAKNRKLWAPAGKYAVSNTINNTSNKNRLWIIGDGPDTTEFQQLANFANGPVINSIGSISADLALTAPVDKGDCLITVADTSLIQPEMYVLLMDTTQVLPMGNPRSAVTCVGEFQRVRTIVSGTQFKTYGALEFSYTVAGTYKRLYATSPITAEGFSIRNLAPGTQLATTRGITANYSVGSRISDLAFYDMDASQIGFSRGCRADVIRCEFWNAQDDLTLRTPYCITPYNDTFISDCRGFWGRHLVTAGGDMFYGPVSHVVVNDCTATEFTASAFDTHPGTYKWTFNNCKVYGSNNDFFGGEGETSGFQIRGTDMELNYCRVDGVPNKGVYIVYGADRTRVIGGRFENCGESGIVVQDSDDCYIGGEALIRNPGVSGIDVYPTQASYSAYVTQLNIGNVIIDLKESPSSAMAVNNQANLKINYL